MTKFDPIHDYPDVKDILWTQGPSLLPLDVCDDFLKADLPQNVSSAPLPCSLFDEQGVVNLVNAEFVYETLEEGISQVNSSFNQINFTALDAGEADGSKAPYQLVTTLQNDTLHTMYFNPDQSEEADLTDLGFGPDYGVDYVASSTSMTTECTIATRECKITAPSNLTNINQYNISIPFHCYDDFSGNLGQTPRNGHERAGGWNTSFYSLTDDKPQNIPFQAHSNPFTYYVAAAVSLDPRHKKHPFSKPLSRSALEPTTSMKPPNSPSRTANTTTGANTASDLASIMALALSQTGMSLASGVFDFTTKEVSARQRWTLPDITQIDKKAFWFLIVVCLFYAAFGFATSLVAVFFRRDPDLRARQASLMESSGVHAAEFWKEKATNGTREFVDPIVVDQEDQRRAEGAAGKT